MAGLTAFRPNYPGMYNPFGQSRVYVSEEFKDAWLGAGLTGIDFKPVDIPDEAETQKPTETLTGRIMNLWDRLRRG